MNAGSANWNWPEVESVLAALAASEEDLIVCGGQAVAFWAQHFGLHPVVSQDLDVIGDRDAAERMAERYRTARQPGNRRVLDRLQLDWKTLAPIERLQTRHASDPLVVRFLPEQWPRLARE